MFATAQKAKAKPKNASLFQGDRDTDAFIQPKLNIGKSGDQYEVEADRVADTVVSGDSEQHNPFFGASPKVRQQTQEEDIQEKQTEDKKEASHIQKKTLAETITPLVRKQPEEEQLQEKEAIGEDIQKKTLFENRLQEKSDAKLLVPHIQKQEEVQEKENEVKLQENSVLQMSEEPDTDVEEETIPVQTKSNEETAATPSIESQLNNSIGRGSPLSEATKSTMESGFGTDFSNIRVHKDSNAIQMNQQLGSQAFASSNDIYFNEGKYSPESDSGKHLLAHELTHTVQQGASVQPKIIQKTNTPSATEETAERNFIDTDEGTLDLRDGKKEIHIKKLDIPSFKKVAGFYPATPFRLPPREERNTNQRQNWDTHIKNNDEGLDQKLQDLYSQQIPAEVGAGTEPRYYLKVKNANYNIIGTQTEIKNRVLRPFWDPTGNFQFYHVDHQNEIQLGGAAVDVIPNYWLLDANSNMASGRMIKTNKDTKLRGILGDARTSDNFDVVPGAINDVRGQDYTILVDEVGASETQFDIKTITATEAQQGKATEGLSYLSSAELQALRGSPNELVIFFNQLGGMSRRIPWEPDMTTQADLSGMSGGARIGENFELLTINYTHGSGGSITGRAFQDNTFIQNETLTMELQSSPIVEYGGVIPKRSLTAEANKLIAKHLSPISFSEIDFIPDKGIYAVGKIRASLPVIENAEVDILIDGNTVRIFKTFSTGEFNVPSPFEIHDSSLTVFAGTEGLGIEGRVDFGINNVGEGHIGASASTSAGFELEGAFNFDSELFDPAEINVEYKDNIWNIGGEIGIPEGKVRGVKNATITATYSEGNFAATGEAELDIPGIQRGTMTVNYGEEGFSISGNFDLSDDIPGIQGGNVEARVSKAEGAENYDVFVSGTAIPDIPGISTSLTVTYDNGALTIVGSAAYSRGMLSGSIEVGATNRTIGEDGQPTGEPDDTMRVYGGGTLTLQLTPWLAATAGVKLLPNGEIEVTARLATDTYDVFARREFNRNLFTVPTIEIPIFAIPLGPRSLGLVAQISGGLDFTAGFGPGQLRNLSAEITYNPAREDETIVTGHGEFGIPADAGLTLRGDLGLGLSVGIASLSGGIELAGTLGLEGEALASVDVSWSPQTGIILDAEGRVTVNPKFTFDVNAFARASLGIGFLSISETWRHNLVSFSWGPDIQFGLVFPVHYQEDLPFDISFDDLEVIYPDLDVVDMAVDLARDIKDDMFD